GRHAALEDAESAELGAAVHDGDGFAEIGGDAGGVETGGAAADDEKIEAFHFVGSSRKKRGTRRAGASLARRGKVTCSSRACAGWARARRRGCPPARRSRAS